VNLSELNLIYHKEPVLNIVTNRLSPLSFSLVENNLQLDLRSNET